MKKIILAVMAVAAISFTSCGNKTQQAEAAAVDSTAIIQANVDQAVEATIEDLNEDLQESNVNELQETLEQIKQKVAELIKSNPEAAQEYIAKIQAFLKENADKVKGLVGDNAAVAAALSAITDAEPAAVVSGLLQSVGDAATEAKDAAVDAANEAKDAAVDAAKEKANEAVDAAANKTKEALGI